MKRIITFFLGIICVSYVFSFMLCNYHIIKNNNIGLIDINENNIEISNDNKKTIIKIKDENNSQYINKLLFNYNTETILNWEMTVKYINKYGLADSKTIEGRTSPIINTFEEKIDLKVDELKIEFSDQINANNFKVNNKIDYFSNYTIFYMILGIDIGIIFIFRKRLKDKIEYLFLVLALSGGIIIIAMHPFGVNISWDDQIHYENIYGLANKYYTVSGMSLIDPDGFQYKLFNTETENKEVSEYLNKMNKEVTDVKTQKNFSIQKITYLPSVIIFKLCNILNIPFSIAFLLGKLIILFIYIIIVFLAIKITPKFKYLMLVIALIPVELFMAANYTYDAPIVAFSLLGFALYFKELISKEKINYKRIVGIIISFIIASCAKAIYCPILLILLLIPKEKFDSKKQRYSFYIFLALIFILMMSTFMIPLFNHEMHGDPRGGNTSIGGQIKFIINNPISFVKIAYNNVVLQFFDKFFSTLAIYDLQYMKPHMSSFGYYPMLILMFLSIYINDEKNLKYNKIFLGIILVMIIGMIWGSLFLFFTPVGAEVIQGVQGRYFIPLLLPLLMLVYTDKIKCDLPSEKLYSIFSIALIIITFLEIYECIL